MQEKSDAQNITLPLLTKIYYLYNERTPSYLRDIILLCVEHSVKVLRRID